MSELRLGTTLEMQSELWKSTATWFADWFNCPEYHILYGARDEREAEHFVEQLVQAVAPSPPARVLDLACGSGRHVRSFAALGYDAFGVDLSPESIATAQAQSSNPERYEVADMRHFADQLPHLRGFDLVTSLFTSFGYFEEDADQIQTLSQIRKALQPGGIFVLDFLNVPGVRAGLVPHEHSVREVPDGSSMSFEIHRRMAAGWIEKSIQFTDKSGRSRHVVERVRALDNAALTGLLERAGFQVHQRFGDYALGPYSEKSNRCILVAS